MSPGAFEIETVAHAEANRPDWLTDFVPRRGLSNGHVQTIVGNFLPRPRSKFRKH